MKRGDKVFLTHCKLGAYLSDDEGRWPSGKFDEILEDDVGGRGYIGTVVRALDNGYWLVKVPFTTRDLFVPIWPTAKYCRVEAAE